MPILIQEETNHAEGTTKANAHSAIAASLNTSVVTVRSGVMGLLTVGSSKWTREETAVVTLSHLAPNFKRVVSLKVLKKLTNHPIEIWRVVKIC